MTFAQLSPRLKNLLRGWLLVLGLKEGLVECATVCVKSVVILKYNDVKNKILSQGRMKAKSLGAKNGSFLVFKLMQTCLPTLI